MARIKCNINEDSTLVKFEAIENGEIFVRDEMPYLKVKNIDRIVNALSLMGGETYSFPDDELVTYVKKAELKLTI